MTNKFILNFILHIIIATPKGDRTLDCVKLNWTACISVLKKDAVGYHTQEPRLCLRFSITTRRVSDKWKDNVTLHKHCLGSQQKEISAQRINLICQTASYEVSLKIQYLVANSWPILDLHVIFRTARYVTNITMSIILIVQWYEIENFQEQFLVLFRNVYLKLINNIVLKRILISSAYTNCHTSVIWVMVNCNLLT